MKYRRSEDMIYGCMRCVGKGPDILHVEVENIVSYFSDLLDELIRHHDMKAVDLCGKMEISRSCLSKWRNGTLLPANIETVRRLSESIRLSIEENEKLFSAYKLTRFGISYYQISEYMDHQFQMDFQCKKRTGEDVAQYACPENGTFFSNKVHVIVAIRQLLRHSEGTLWMQLLPTSNDICDLIREELHGTGRKCKWLMYLNSTCNPSPENLSMFLHAMPLMLDGAEVRYSYINLRSFFEYSMFPFMLITEKAVLVMSRDCSSAMYFNVEEFVAFYRQGFVRHYQSAVMLGKSFGSPEEFLDGYDDVFLPETSHKEMDLYIIEKCPCVMYGGDGNTVFQHVADMPEKNVFVRRYMEFLHEVMQDVKTAHTVFSVEGMTDFFEKEEYFELSNKLSQNIPFQSRRKLMRQFIGQAEKNDRLQPKLLMRSILDHSCIKVVNLWSDGKMIFVLEYGDELHILAAREPSVVGTLISYMDYLGECGTMLSKAQTLKKLHDAWDKYGNPAYTV